MVSASQVIAEIEINGDPLRLVSYQKREPGRAEVEKHIAKCFERKHGAQVRAFMPMLLSLESKSGEILAAVGLRRAGAGKLFLEHYLDMPAECAIADLTGQSCRRESLVEVGNLAVASAGLSRYFFAILAKVLTDWGVHWLVCTSTKEVLNVFRRMNVRPYVISAADPECLPDGGVQWGTYYANNPQVVVGELDVACRGMVQPAQLSTFQYIQGMTSHASIA